MHNNRRILLLALTSVFHFSFNSSAQKDVTKLFTFNICNVEIYDDVPADTPKYDDYRRLNKGPKLGEAICSFSEGYPTISLHFDKIKNRPTGYGEPRGKRIILVPKKNADTGLNFYEQTFIIPYKDTTSNYTIRFEPQIDGYYLNSYMNNDCDFGDDPYQHADQHGLWAIDQVYQGRGGRHAIAIALDLDAYRLYSNLNSLGYEIQSQEYKLWPHSKDDLLRIQASIDTSQWLYNYVPSLSDLIDTTLYYAGQPLQTFMEPDSLLIHLLNSERSKETYKCFYKGDFSNIGREYEDFGEEKALLPSMRSTEYNIFDMCRIYLKDAFLEKLSSASISQITKILQISAKQLNSPQIITFSESKNDTQYQYWSFLTRRLQRWHIECYTAYHYERTLFIQILERALIRDLENFSVESSKEMADQLTQLRNILQSEFRLTWLGLCKPLDGSGSHETNRYSGARPKTRITNFDQKVNSTLGELYLQCFRNPDVKANYLQYLNNLAYGVTDGEGNQYVDMESQLFDSEEFRNKLLLTGGEITCSPEDSYSYNTLIEQLSESMEYRYPYRAPWTSFSWESTNDEVIFRMQSSNGSRTTIIPFQSERECSQYVTEFLELDSAQLVVSLTKVNSTPRRLDPADFSIQVDRGQVQIPNHLADSLSAVLSETSIPTGSIPSEVYSLEQEINKLSAATAELEEFNSSFSACPEMAHSLGFSIPEDQLLQLRQSMEKITTEFLPIADAIGEAGARERAEQERKRLEAISKQRGTYFYSSREFNFEVIVSKSSWASKLTMKSGGWNVPSGIEFGSVIENRLMDESGFFEIGRVRGTSIRFQFNNSYITLEKQ